jgi:hypothetical protein
MSRKAGVAHDLSPKKEQLLMPKPQLSFVIFFCVGVPFVSQCLRLLEGQRVERSEFIVVDRAGVEVVGSLALVDFRTKGQVRRLASECGNIDV